jgi:hypothetical protein
MYTLSTVRQHVRYSTEEHAYIKIGNLPSQLCQVWSSPARIAPTDKQRHQTVQKGLFSINLQQTLLNNHYIDGKEGHGKGFYYLMRNT